MAGNARLAELCEAIVDCPHSTPAWTGRGVIVLRNQNIRNGRLDLSESSFTDEKHFAERTRRATPKEGDIVITREAPMGEVCMIPAGLRCCLGQRMVLLRPNRERTESRYLLYALQSNAVQHEIGVNEGTGSTVSNLRIPLLESLPIPVRSLPEQRAIAHILGTLDDKIELNRRMSETLGAMARALFRSWFVDFDPVRAKAEGRDPGLPQHLADLFPARLVDSGLGEIPEGWEVGSIYEIADVIYGAPFASAQFNNDLVGEPLIRIRDLGNEAPGVWTPELHPRGYKVRPGDIVVGMDGEFRAYLWGGAEAWLNQRVCVFAPKSGWSAAFVRNAIIEPLARVEATETATTVIHLGKSDIDLFKVAIPSRDLAVFFNTTCQPCYDRIVASKQESRTLAALRDALLPKLISGELRVKDAERFIEGLSDG